MDSIQRPIDPSLLEQGQHSAKTTTQQNSTDLPKVKSEPKKIEMVKADKRQLLGKKIGAWLGFAGCVGLCALSIFGIPLAGLAMHNVAENKKGWAWKAVKNTGILMALPLYGAAMFWDYKNDLNRTGLEAKFQKWY